MLRSVRIGPLIAERLSDMSAFLASALPALTTAAFSRSMRAASFFASLFAFSAAFRFLSASRFAASSAGGSFWASTSAMVT